MNGLKLNFHQRGSIIMESLISIVIIGFGALALIKLQGQVMSGISSATQYTEANSLAHSKIENLRNIPNDTVYNNSIVAGTDSPNGRNTTYTRSWNVTEFNNPDYKLIEVSIAWVNKENKNKQLKLSTFIGKIDPALSGKHYAVTN